VDTRALEMEREVETIHLGAGAYAAEAGTGACGEGAKGSVVSHGAAAMQPFVFVRQACLLAKGCKSRMSAEVHIIS